MTKTEAGSPDRGKSLPRMQGRSYQDTLFENETNIYFDMIELLDLYPESKLKQGGAKLKQGGTK